jgi:hypothetical protein
MTESEIRALVRAAIAQHSGTAVVQRPREPFPGGRQHPSHALFVLPSGADAGGPCIIEPAVACNHCGYCKSLGH